MNWNGFRKSETVAQRRAKAEKAGATLKKQGKTLEPVRIEGRAMATTFWGKAWCQNLESYRDYESRLPRGRSYARNGSVLDLKLAPGTIDALVQGSRRYTVKITIAPLPRKHWDAFKNGTSGRIASAIALLSGQLSDDVLQQIVAPGSGLFPKPAEIRFSCSCPDWAVMCKHVAAVLYGVGHRLDTRPELFFTLRKVDAAELIAHVTSAGILTGPAGATGQRKKGARGKARAEHAADTLEALSGDALGELFGIALDMAPVKKPVRK